MDREKFQFLERFVNFFIFVMKCGKHYYSRLLRILKSWNIRDEILERFHSFKHFSYHPYDIDPGHFCKTAVFDLTLLMTSIAMTMRRKENYSSKSSNDFYNTYV